MERDEIIKALECCIEGECDGCTYDEQTACKEYILHDALALITSQEQRIKELTEENERLRAEDVIRLPLKVGDIVYSYTRFWRKEDGISPYQITNITITQNKKGIWTKKYRAMRMLSGRKIDDQLNFAFDEIGKTVFLTLIEADQIAKEMLEGEK